MDAQNYFFNNKRTIKGEDFIDQSDFIRFAIPLEKENEELRKVKDELLEALRKIDARSYSKDEWKDMCYINHIAKTAIHNSNKLNP